MTLSGGCRCGTVRYELELAPGKEALPITYACHCLDCQTWSGSAFTMHTLVPADALTVTGEHTTYVYRTGSGHESRHHVCGVCHTRIYNTNAALQGMVVLRAGTLEESAALQPIAHIWTKRKQRWIVLPEGVASWEENPTPEQFAAALHSLQP